MIIPDNVFRKMSNKHKMALEIQDWIIYNPITVLMIRTNRKNWDWYSLSAFFIQTKEWWVRSHDYDVLFSYSNTHIDFEQGWVKLFTPNAVSFSTWSLHY